MNNSLERKEEESISPIITKVLTKEDFERLFPLVNSDRDWKIDVRSHKLVDKIIELWFESQGYDFWDNPYPEVIEWSLNKDKTKLEFKYLKT